MKQRLRLTLLILLCWLPRTVLAEVQMATSGQVTALAEDIKKSLTTDPRVQNQSLSLGTFAGQGKKIQQSNFGLRIEQEFRQRLSAFLKDEAKLTLAGSYHFVASESADNSGADVLVITAQIQNDRGKEILAFTREVNDTDDIRSALGITGAGATPQATFKERNEALKADLVQPQFELINGNQVAAKGRPAWSVGILKKSQSNSPASVLTPQNMKGQAYVPLAIEDYYEIELFNNDVSDAVAVVTIDGLDVANTFASDKKSNGQAIVWPGYLVPKPQNGKPGTILIRGWLNTIRPTESRDNVFSFLVKELGQGAASAQKKRGSIGVITVQFFEACPPDGKLSQRSFGETAKGEGLEEKYTTTPVQIGDNAQSTVTIRYNLPQE